MGKSDPFTLYSLSDDPSEEWKTDVKDDTLDPNWNYDKLIPISIKKKLIP